jgi:hypothetical protein
MFVVLRPHQKSDTAEKHTNLSESKNSVREACAKTTGKTCSAPPTCCRDTFDPVPTSAIDDSSCAATNSSSRHWYHFRCSILPKFRTIAATTDWLFLLIRFSSSLSPAPHYNVRNNKNSYWERKRPTKRESFLLGFTVHHRKHTRKAGERERQCTGGSVCVLRTCCGTPLRHLREDEE